MCNSNSSNSNSSNNSSNNNSSNKTDAKYLGALVSPKLYNQFKAVAALRGESMQEAVANAAMLYIDVEPQMQEGVICNG